MKHSNLKQSPSSVKEQLQTLLSHPELKVFLEDKIKRLEEQGVDFTSFESIIQLHSTEHTPHKSLFNLKGFYQEHRYILSDSSKIMEVLNESYPSLGAYLKADCYIEAVVDVREAINEELFPVLDHDKKHIHDTPSLYLAAELAHCDYEFSLVNTVLDSDIKYYVLGQTNAIGDMPFSTKPDEL